MFVRRPHRVRLLVAIALVAAVAGIAIWRLRSDRTESLLQAARQAQARREFEQMMHQAADALAISPHST